MVLAAMGLSRLPGAGEGLRGPVPRVDEDGNYRLLYLASSGGALWIQREYRLDRFAPYLPLAVTFRLPDGTVRMTAALDRYEPVGRSSVYVAREIRMYWPETEDTLSMRIGSIKFDADFGPGARAYQIRSTIPRSRWIRVGNEPRRAKPVTRPRAGTEPAASRPALAAAPTTTEPVASEPAMPAEAPGSEPAAAPEAVAAQTATSEPTATQVTAPEPVLAQPGQGAPASEPDSVPQ